MAPAFLNITFFSKTKNDFLFYTVGLTANISNFFYIYNFREFLTKLNDSRKFILKKYIYTVNHKRLGLYYLYFSFWAALSGAALATMIRLELAYPGSQFFKGDTLRYLQVITCHALVMVFFAITPFFYGAAANYLIPYHVGSKDVAFPRLNSLGFWIQPAGFILVAKPAFMRQQFYKYYDKPSFFFPLLDKSNARKFQHIKNSEVTPLTSLLSNKPNDHLINWAPRKKINYTNYSTYSFLPFKLSFWSSIVNYPESLWFAATKVSKLRRRKVYFSKCSNRTLTLSGWTFLPPFSGNFKYTGLGSQDLIIAAVIAYCISSTISTTNLLITRRTLAMPGLRNRKSLLPFLTITLFLMMRLLAIVIPILAAAMVMLLLDRHWQTTFFEYVYGGDPVLFQHLFWFFGHPEVYVIIIPVFGIVNQAIPAGNSRRIAAKTHLMWATYAMAYMGCIVWGHHMYLVGLDHRSRNLFSTFTVMISLPAIVKIVNWTLTFLNGGLKIDLVMINVFLFFWFFLCGGMTGMWLSHVSLNLYVHDTFYIVAHFHFMFSASSFTGAIICIYYYFTAFFGIKYSRLFGYAHAIYWFAGQWLTFIPLFFIGYNGLPRRYHDYPIVFIGWHGMSSVGHSLTLISIVFFFFMLLDSHIERRVSLLQHFGMPRWHKRVIYYLYKIRHLQTVSRTLSRLPNKQIREHIIANYFTEYERYAKI